MSKEKVLRNNLRFEIRLRPGKKMATKNRSSGKGPRKQHLIRGKWDVER